ncbi:MucB/RseB C-terminal domain-containing protein [Chitinimonas sp. PSY-7]|uniref:MucB/RseB C-terminal domain-containing protein n=1 Tax=Chitinimonas sp. PSY-7 TaxID=3459088 RepID=UPI0040400ABA
MKLRFGLCSLLLVVSAQAAELLTASESVNLLHRMGMAARSLNYSGVYVYQHAEMLETFRLVHAFDASGEQERRESLDGLRREFVRTNDQIVCYLPDSKPFVLDRRAANKFFPGVMPDQAADVLSSYAFKRLDTERVAGYDCQSILMEPRDKLRHPHKLCVEPSSGLLLKTTMYSTGRREPLEQFAFTQLEIGGQINKQLLKSVLASKALPLEMPATPAGPRTAPVVSPELSTAQFVVDNLPGGFRLVTETRSQIPGKSAPVLHYLYSDGMATVSVFIEPAGNGPVSLPLTQGTVNFFSRQIDGWRITALGEVPLRTVQLFTQAYSQR